MRVEASSRSRGDSSSSMTSPTWRKNIGERQIGAAGMIDADEAAVGDDVERLLAAIVGMRAPADVGEQAGGMAQAPLRRPFHRGPSDAMKRSVQSISSSPWRGERERKQVELARRRRCSGSFSLSFCLSSE